MAVNVNAGAPKVAQSVHSDLLEVLINSTAVVARLAYDAPNATLRFPQGCVWMLAGKYPTWRLYVNVALFFIE